MCLETTHKQDTLSYQQKSQNRTNIEERMIIKKEYKSVGITEFTKGTLLMMIIKHINLLI